MVRRLPIVLLVPIVLAACGGDDGPVAAPAATDPPTLPTPATTSATTSPVTEPAPTTTEPEIEIPTGVLVAVPIQNREDPAKNQFQAQMHNGTGERYDVSGVQFVWDGFTTDLTRRDSIIVGGQVIDFPVPFPGAACTGDGTRQTMPSLDAAHVVLQLDNGDKIDVPVVDKWHVARSLYEDDCEKQMIDSLVTIEWFDLHEDEYEGRPVTVGELRLTRRDGVGEIVVLSVSNTVPFVFMAVDTAVGEPVVTLSADQAVASAPVRFVESRCDPHALAEIKQPTKFIAQIQLGDGVIHPYIIYPERDRWIPMRLTADKACVQLGKVVFVGD